MHAVTWTGDRPARASASGASRPGESRSRNKYPDDHQSAYDDCCADDDGSARTGHRSTRLARNEDLARASRRSRRDPIDPGRNDQSPFSDD